MAGFTVISVTADQIPDVSDNLIDVYDVAFSITDKPGTFTVQVPTNDNPVTAAEAAIAAVVEQINSIYSL